MLVTPLSFQRIIVKQGPPQAARRTLPGPSGRRNDTAASPDGPINKAPEETLLNKSNPCQSFLELRRNTTSYGPISNPQLSTSGTDGATCLYYPKNILWQYIFSQSYADMVVFINFTIFAVRWVDH